jgi:hypothetical protein
MKNTVYERKANLRKELHDRIFDVAVRMTDPDALGNFKIIIVII